MKRISPAMFVAAFLACPCDIKPEKVVFEVPEKKEDASSQLLDVVYGVDPVTRLPFNDVAVFLSPKVDPAIKEFIQLNLMSPHPSSHGVDDVHSDILFDLIRGDNESQSDYANRIQQIIISDNGLIAKESEVKVDNPE